jgi:hypothetical protein
VFRADRTRITVQTGLTAAARAGLGDPA